MRYGEFISSFLIDLQRLFRSDISIKDMTYSQVLAIISIPNDGIEMSELARKLGLDNSTITRLMVRLENKGWVGRKQSRRDKRAIKVFLKTPGLVLQNDIEKKIESIGEKIKIEIDDEKRRVSLSIKQCQENPWVKFEEKYNKGDILESEIKSVTDFGIFVGLDGGIDGLIHVTDITKDENQEEELRKYKKGEQVKTIILSVDAERERVSLGIKQLDSN